MNIDRWRPVHRDAETVEMVKCLSGEWISRYDLQRVESSYTVWGRQLESENTVLRGKNAALENEVERLREAGESVACCLEAYLNGKPYGVQTTIKCFDSWNAAKEGGDAK